MKRQLKFIIVLLIGYSTQVFAFQDDPASVRLSNSFIKDADGSRIEVRARTRVGRRFENITDLSINFYYMKDSVRILAKSEPTNHDGIASWMLDFPVEELIDSTGAANFRISVEDQQGYMDGESELAIKIADLQVQFEEIDSIGYIKAVFLDRFSGQPMEDIGLRLYVKRYFSPFWLSDIEFSDAEGSIAIELDKKLPGDKNGNIIIGAMVEDNDDYGTIYQEIEVPWGIPYIEDKSFDNRNMWSPRNKTPLWLLIFPNLIIIGVWGTLVYLVRKLYVIYKS